MAIINRLTTNAGEDVWIGRSLYSLLMGVEVNIVFTEINVEVLNH